MKSMALSILPSRKIHAIVSAAHCVFRKLNELSMLEHSKPPGADEFMDAWVYVVLKSKIPNLASTIAILRGYSNPNLAFSEAGYYLSSVEFACRYLERINEQDYRDKSHLLTERLVVCEQARFGKMAQEETAVFEIVSQDKWLQGFEVFAVKEWHLDPTRFYRTVIVPSLDASTKVKVSVVKVRPENTSFSQLEMLEQVFMCPGDENGLSCTRTNNGIAVTLHVDHVRDQLTLIPIPDGNYDVFEDTVTNFATLDKLACDYNPPSRNAPAEIVLMTTVMETMQKMEDIVSSTYSIPKAPDGAVRNLIGALVTDLRQMNYLSSLFDTPEVYSALIQSAVQKFQTDYNRNCQSSTSRLPSNGLLCPSTWAALQNSIGKVTKTATPNS